MSDLYYEQTHWIEDIGLYFEQMGLPRMAGRILGVLLIADPPQQSINDLCELLQASKSAVSTTARLLSEMGLIERAAGPAPRRAYFQFSPGGWVIFIRQRLKLWAALHQLAERGLELTAAQPKPTRRRLQEAHDMFSAIEAELPALLERIEIRHAG